MLKRKIFKYANPDDINTSKMNYELKELHVIGVLFLNKKHFTFYVK